jgi:hypothetical protein
MDFNALRKQCLTGDEQTVRLALASDCYNGIVFDRNPDVALAACSNFGVQCALKLPRFRVRTAPEIEKKSSPDGS